MKQTHYRPFFVSQQNTTPQGRTQRDKTFRSNSAQRNSRDNSLVRIASLGAAGGVLLLGGFTAPVRAEEPSKAPDSLNVPRVGLRTTVPTESRATFPVSAAPEARPVGLAKYAPTFDAESILARHHLLARRETCQFGIVSSPVPIGIRLGAALSPRLKFDGGIDVTIPGLTLAHNFSTRVDLDAIVDANFGGFSTLFPLTFDQIYRLALPVGSSLYFGGGIGPYFGERTRFGGKLLIGGTITSHFGLEGAIHFQGYGDPIATVQARFPF